MSANRTAQTSEAEAWEPCTLSFTFLASASLSVSQVKNLVLPCSSHRWHREIGRVLTHDMSPKRQRDFGPAARCDRTQLAEASAEN